MFDKFFSFDILDCFLFQVALHRLSWQKVWTLAAPCEMSKVAALAWRPDGKGTACETCLETVLLNDGTMQCSNVDR
jgi:hypothetical protein